MHFKYTCTVPITIFLLLSLLPLQPLSAAGEDVVKVYVKALFNPTIAQMIEAARTSLFASATTYTPSSPAFQGFAQGHEPSQAQQDQATANGKPYVATIYESLGVGVSVLGPLELERKLLSNFADAVETAATTIGIPKIIFEKPTTGYGNFWSIKLAEVDTQHYLNRFYEQLIQTALKSATLHEPFDHALQQEGVRYFGFDPANLHLSLLRFEPINRDHTTAWAPADKRRFIKWLKAWVRTEKEAYKGPGNPPDTVFERLENRITNSRGNIQDENLIRIAHGFATPRPAFALEALSISYRDPKRLPGSPLFTELTIIPLHEKKAPAAPAKVKPPVHHATSPISQVLEEFQERLNVLRRRTARVLAYA